MKAQWWIRDGNRVSGPVSVEELRAMAENSQLRPDSLVRLGRTTQWVKARSFRWLQESLQTSGKNAVPLPSEVAKPGRTTATGYAAIASVICVLALVALMVLFLVGGGVVAPVAQREPDGGEHGRPGSSQSQSGQVRSSASHIPIAELEKPSSSIPLQRGLSEPDGIIKDIRDELSIEQAVGLVVCGWEGVTNKSEAFEHRIQPLFYSRREFAALTPHEQEEVTELRLPNGKNIFFKILLGSTGSCFLISRDGYLLTNKHVIEESHRIAQEHRVIQQIMKQHEYKKLQPRVWVFVGKKVFEADILHVSRQFDLAILKIDIDNAPFFRLASSDELARAAEVWAIGFPGASRNPISDEENEFERKSWANAKKIESFFKPSDLAYVLTSGSVSVVSDREGLGRIIQHNADVSGGNSGGPLVNNRAVVVGINTISITQASGGIASGIFLSLTMGQLRSEIDQYTPACVWE